MDLTTLRNFFEACNIAENQLQESWAQFAKLPSYCLFKLIATRSQPKIDASLIRQFIIGFNWQTVLTLDFLEDQPNYKIYSLKPQLNQDQLLDYGLDLLVNYWGVNQAITFDQFTLMIKGQVELPNKTVEVPFASKRNLFQSLMSEIKNLIKIQETKKLVYHEYKNLADLFEMVTANKHLDNQGVKRLFLSFSIRKNEAEIERICKRAKIPWDFSEFLKKFKRTPDKGNEYKIYHSARRNKNEEGFDKAFTTPRKQKFAYHQSSTKLTKVQDYEDELTTTPKKKIIASPGPQFQPHHVYITVLADLLLLEEEFIKECTECIKRKDFDLELVYERHGKKFEKILVARYGVCNFSAFVRFIVPRDYEHRYLSFIRYEANNQLSQETQRHIDLIIQKHRQKQAQIQQIWTRCDKQMLLRYFCKPSQESIPNDKLKQLFTSREVRVLLDRLDPDQVGSISLQALK